MGLGWRAPLLVVSILLLRRLPIVLLLHPLLGRVRGIREALFLGWFGPIGVAALVYGIFALSRTGHEHVWTITSLLIAASVVAHGLTATPSRASTAAGHSTRMRARRNPRSRIVDDSPAHLGATAA